MGTSSSHDISKWGASSPGDRIVSTTSSGHAMFNRTSTLPLAATVSLLQGPLILGASCEHGTFYSTTNICTLISIM